MTIETKFNIGDEVWAIIGEEEILVTIVGITTETYGGKTLIYYELCISKGVYASLIEQCIYRTKQELLDIL